MYIYFCLDISCKGNKKVKFNPWRVKTGNPFAVTSEVKVCQKAKATARRK